MIHTEPYVTLIVSGGTITNVNKNAYNLDTSSFSYISDSGAVFHLIPVANNTSYEAFNYVFSDLIIDKVYAQRGGAFYFYEGSEIGVPHDCVLTISNVTIQNSYSLGRGIMFIAETQFDFTINMTKYKNIRVIDKVVNTPRDTREPRLL